MFHGPKEQIDGVSIYKIPQKRTFKLNSNTNSNQLRELHSPKALKSRPLIYYQNEIKGLTDLFTRVFQSPLASKKAADNFRIPSNVNVKNLMTNSDLLKQKFEFKFNQKANDDSTPFKDASSTAIPLEIALSKRSGKKSHHVDLTINLSPTTKSCNIQTDQSSFENITTNSTRANKIQRSNKQDSLESSKKKPDEIKGDVIQKSFWLSGQHLGPKTASHKTSNFINLKQQGNSDLLPWNHKEETSNSSMHNRSVRLKNPIQVLKKTPSLISARLKTQNINSEKNFALVIGKITENDHFFKPKNSLATPLSNTSKARNPGSRIESIRPESFSKLIAKSPLQRRQTTASFRKYLPDDKLRIGSNKPIETEILSHTDRHARESKALSQIPS